jgi:hypothetical protein
MSAALAGSIISAMGKEGSMMVEEISGTNRACLERCYFEAENCRQKDDGTWDCNKRQEDCESHCRM